MDYVYHSMPIAIYGSMILTERSELLAATTPTGAVWSRWSLYQVVSRLDGNANDNVNDQWQRTVQGWYVQSSHSQVPRMLVIWAVHRPIVVDYHTCI